MYYYTHYWTQALNKKNIPIVICASKIKIAFNNENKYCLLNKYVKQNNYH